MIQQQPPQSPICVFLHVHENSRSAASVHWTVLNYLPTGGIPS